MIAGYSLFFKNHKLCSGIMLNDGEEEEQKTMLNDGEEEEEQKTNEEAPSQVVGTIATEKVLRLPDFKFKDLVLCKETEITSENYGKVLDELVGLVTAQLQDAQTAVDSESSDYFKALIRFLVNKLPANQKKSGLAWFLNKYFSAIGKITSLKPIVPLVKDAGYDISDTKHIGLGTWGSLNSDKKKNDVVNMLGVRIYPEMISGRYKGLVLACVTLARGENVPNEDLEQSGYVCYKV